MSFYTCFDWFKKLSTFSYVLNLKIDVVPKASHAVVIRRFSLNEAPLGLFKFILDYLPYFEKTNIFFNIIAKNIWINLYKDWSKLFVRFIRNNLNPGCTHPCVTRYLRCVQPGLRLFRVNRTHIAINPYITSG
jgi:hypothetical protein